MGASSSTIGNVLYEGELIKSEVGAVVVTIFGILAIVYGIYDIARRKEKTAVTTGTIKSADCTTTYTGRTTIINCNLTVEYTVDKKVLTGKTSTTGSIYNKGAVVPIEYDPKNPSSFQIRGFNKNFIGGIVIGSAILIMALTWLNLYFVKKSKTYGQFMAVSDISRRF